jgi:Hsp70 protein
LLSLLLLLLLLLLLQQECLVEERDYTGRLSLDDFERLITPLVNRMSAPIEQALKEAGVTRADLEAVEIVGGATRYVCMKHCTNVYNKYITVSVVIMTVCSGAVQSCSCCAV